MSTDPVQLPGLLAALPREDEYEAICAEVMKTARGRWFLTEYSARNKDADTQALIAAIGRVEAATRADPPAPTSDALRSALRDVARAINLLEGAVAAIGILARDGFAPAERISDIAFALREGKVDAAMCEALEAASRQLTHVLAGNDAALERAQGAIAALRELAGRMDAIVVGVRAAAGAEILNQDRSAAEVGAPAGRSLSADRRGTIAAAGRARVADPGAYSFSGPSRGEPSDKDTATAEVSISKAPINKKSPSSEITDAEARNDSASPPGVLRENAAGKAASFGHEPAASAASGAQNQATTNHVARVHRAGVSAGERLDAITRPAEPDVAGAPGAEESDFDSIFEPEAMPESLPDSQAMAGSEEDPGDLFEPAALAPGGIATNGPQVKADARVVAPMHEAAATREDEARSTAVSYVAAAAVAVTDRISPRGSSTVSAEMTRPASLTPEPLQQPGASAVTPVVPMMTAAGPGERRDPLADLRALSEEELIALFS